MTAATDTVTATAPSPALYRAPVTKNSNRWVLTALLTPGLLGIAASFIVPLIVLMRMSLNETQSGGQLVVSLSTDSYRTVLSDPFYWEIIGNTLVMGVFAGLVAVILSYPIALFLTRSESAWKGVLIALAIAPLLTSAVSRTYGWIALLGDQGLVNSTLTGMGFIDAPLALSNNTTGTVIALVEILMPYSILAMMSGFGRLNSSLEEAAGSLGANRFEVFRRITLPLTMPGVLTGFLLVFVLTISSFVTPKLMGGGRVFVLATEIYNQATQTLNWPLAAGLSVVLLVIFGLIIWLYQRAVKAIEG